MRVLVSPWSNVPPGGCVGLDAQDEFLSENPACRNAGSPVILLDTLLRSTSLKASVSWNSY